MEKRVPRGDLVRMTINLSADLVMKIDEYAKILHVNRTSAMSVLMSQALEQKEVINVMSEMSKFMSQIELMKKSEEREMGVDIVPKG